LNIRSAHRSEFIAIADVWEDSVRATHDFLSGDYINELRPRIINDWLPAVNVMVFTNNDNQILGFSGIVDEKLEMLFVASSARGTGVGRALLNHAITEMAVRLVDVNEQNSQAVGFYQHAGFKVIGRSPLDGQGKPFPILHMAL
jgi:putative acetyltransferase